MKSLILALLAIVATAESQTCVPKSVFQKYCNTCWCSSDGRYTKCTKMECAPGAWNRDGTLKSNFPELPKFENSEQICQPYTTFNDYCNTCRCSADGKRKTCTKMYCDLRFWNKDGTFKLRTISRSNIEESKQVCKPYSTYKEYCNTCSCSADGKYASCTSMACDIEIWNKDGTLIQSKLEGSDMTCVPNTQFSDECNNLCTCGNDGIGAICTRMGC